MSGSASNAATVFDRISDFGAPRKGLETEVDAKQENGGSDDGPNHT